MKNTFKIYELVAQSGRLSIDEAYSEGFGSYVNAQNQLRRLLDGDWKNNRFANFIILEVHSSSSAQ